jgi:hypothetical protein
MPLSYLDGQIFHMLVKVFSDPFLVAGLGCIRTVRRIFHDKIRPPMHLYPD